MGAHSPPKSKLVRDFIPDLLRELGRQPKVKVLHDDKEYLKALNAKLREEVDEYMEGYDIEELADVVEVVDAIQELLEKIAPGELRSVRERKRTQKGGFAARVYLVDQSSHS